MVKADLIENMIADMENGVYDFTKNGECSNCGACCSDIIPISEKEIKRIKQYISKHNIKEQKHIFPIARNVEDYTCPFRSDKEKKCLIYEVRPSICRDFRCDKPKKKIKLDKEKYNAEYGVCFMRQTFFGGK